MHDVDNRLSSVDLSTPGGRFVIASDENGDINPSAQALLPLIPIPYVTSAEAGWDRGLLDPSAVRLAPRTGFALSLDDARAVVRGGYGIFLNQWAYSVQTAFARNLPFFFTQAGRRPVDAARADVSDARHPHQQSDRHRRRRASWTTTTPSSTARRGAAACSTSCCRRRWSRSSYMGSWTLGADNATVRNVPEPGPGSIQARRPIPQLEPINAIRFDGKSIYHGLTFKAERRLREQLRLQRQLHALAPRKTMRRARARRSRKRTSRRTCGTSSTRPASGRTRASTIGTSSSPAARISCRSSRGAGGLTKALLGGWRVNAIFIAQSGAPFTVNLGVDQANIGAGPAQRPDQIRDPNLPRARAADAWFDTPRSRCRRRSPSAARRATA